MTEEELMEWANRQLAGYKKIRGLRILGVLDRLLGGKDAAKQ